ncbi:MAG: hypothetical protein AB7O67_00880 [Vicinamibacterales bacterium]
MTTPTPLPDRELALVIGGGAGVLASVEPLLDGRAYDIEFVDLNDEPYGTVLAMRPSLIVVSLGIDDVDGFGLLSMLRLDPRTASIPVLTYVREEEDELFDLLDGPERPRAPLAVPALVRRH